ncbi:MAG: ABC transporter substrate-binding protein [Candidatus Bipolaricaulota bacterium]|nr:ABC transporter substrate-binding protein [Candidatus Bipolaricaulota bacterium]MDW8030920.1 ABC transporter substrate-binding protein [Candidatus Bipolaricaulota bacterium]
MSLPSVPRVLIGLLVILAVFVGGASQQPGSEVVDALGRVVRFAQPPGRITLAGKGSFMLIDAAYLFPTEARQKIAAVSGAAQLSLEWLALIDPTFRQTKTLLEAQVGPEQIAATKPDAVILRAVEAAKLGPSVERLGIPVVYVELETIERYLNDLRILGQVFGNPKRAEELHAFYTERLGRLAARTREIRDRPRVLVLHYSIRGGTVAFEVAPVGWLQTQMVERAGGNPVWTGTAQPGGWTPVNFEQIAAWNPDILFIIDYSGDSRAVAARLRQEWASLKAVKSHQIYGFPRDFYSWDQPDPRWIVGLTWLATKIHPKLFTDIDMLSELRAFFGLYGLNAETIQTKILPVIKGDFP